MISTQLSQSVGPATASVVTMAMPMPTMPKRIALPRRARGSKARAAPG